MSYNLANNRTILLGFVLAALAIAGMSFFIIQQYTAMVDIAAIRGMDALPVPLKPFNLKMAGRDVDSGTGVGQSTAASKTPPTNALKPAPQISSQPTAIEETLKTESVAITRPKARLEPVAGIQIIPEIPKRIVIPSIGLNAPIVPADVEFEKIWGKEFLQWYVPAKFAAGWHTTSAKLGEPGNTVINGHHNAYGEVFRHLVDLEVGEIVQVESDGHRFSYQITNRMIVPEKYEEIDVRVQNAQWLLPSVDERLTLISCWPYESNTHRLIIVAQPYYREEITPILE